MCGGPPSPNDKTITNKSGRKVTCVKFQKEMPGLDVAPWPGEIGQRVYENVSAQAWKLWEERQKMILNEYRLMPWQKEGQELIMHADGRLLLRRRLRAAAGLRPAADRSRIKMASLSYRISHVTADRS